jgi:hypothetical protein
MKRFRGPSFARKTFPRPESIPSPSHRRSRPSGCEFERGTSPAERRKPCLCKDGLFLRQSVRVALHNCCGLFLRGLDPSKCLYRVAQAVFVNRVALRLCAGLQQADIDAKAIEFGAENVGKNLPA